jgi:hypothetical protein
MANVQDYHDLVDRILAILATEAETRAPEFLENPQLAEDLARQVADALEAAESADQRLPVPKDEGLSQLAGVGPDAADSFGETRIPMIVNGYDEQIRSERIVAVGDLYYLYNYEKIGVFQALLKLQELFKSGTVRLSDGEGAFRLYQFDRRQVLRYTHRDRQQAYQRVFGYTRSTPFPGAEPNREFHRLFVNFNNEVARYFRDKRISEVIRPQSDRGTFGSVAVVRRAGLDLRDNIKHASYGHVNVLRVEVLQLLEEAFTILGSEDVRDLFGADNAWEVVDDILRRYLNKSDVHASARSRMGITGRHILRWLAQPHILNATRIQFEVMLTDIADESEEWKTSAESLGVARPSIVGPTRLRVAGLPVAAAPGRNGGSPAPRQAEEELGSW